jgi:membrane protease YdiL (CAAX protease family)
MTPRRSPFKTAALIAAPLLVLSSMFFLYQVFVALQGPRLGYFFASVHYLVGWCVIFPLWAVGLRPLSHLLHNRHRPGSPFVWLLFVPPLCGLLLALLSQRALPHSGVLIILISALYSAVNAGAEEFLWRGVYVVAFPKSLFWGCLYPAVGSALWRLAPLSVLPSPFPGGPFAYISASLILGLLYGWVAFHTRSIRFTLVSHVALDFTFLGTLIYFN